MPKAASNLHFGKHAQSIARIDADLHDLEIRILKLKAERNRLIPVADLPTEILTGIFGLVQLANGRMTTANILPITWVSHRWRDVAITCPKLWSHIDRSCFSWLKVCLGRSKNYHLSVMITVRAYKYKDKKALTTVLDKSSSRITQLAVEARMDSELENAAFLYEPLMFFPKGSPPFLESLALSWYEIPEHVFSGVTPELRRLVLNGCYFACDMLCNFAGLTHLTLKNLGIKTELHEILGVLSVTPLLEELVLSMIFDFKTGKNIDYDLLELPSVSLPYLTSLQLVEPQAKDCGIILHFLEQVTSPSVVNLHVGLKEIAESDLSTIIGAVNIQHHFPTSRPIRAFAMDLGCTATFSIQLYSSATWNPNEGCIKLSIDVKEREQEACWLADWLCDLPLDSVQALYLDSAARCLPTDIWESLLFPLSNVKEVHVKHFFLRSFVDYFILHTNRDGSSPSPAAELTENCIDIFPIMEKLVLGSWWYIPPKVLSCESQFIETIAVRRKSQLKEVVVERVKDHWEPVVGNAYDVVVNKAEAPCLFEKFEEDGRPYFSDSGSDSDGSDY